MIILRLFFSSTSATIVDTWPSGWRTMSTFHSRERIYLLAPFCNCQFLKRGKKVETRRVFYIVEIFHPPFESYLRELEDTRQSRERERQGRKRMIPRTRGLIAATERCNTREGNERRGACVVCTVEERSSSLSLPGLSLRLARCSVLAARGES